MCQLDRLHRLKAEIYRIARKHNVENMYVFGSCARNKETPEGDVDSLADFNSNASLFDQVGMQLDLADALNFKVDGIPLSCLSDSVLGPSAKKDMVLL